jgi:hypothetical protein
MCIDCQPSSNELDLGLPMASKVGFSVVLQFFFKKLKKKKE